MSNGPIDSLKDYPVEIAIFRREIENGTWLNADVSKTYKDGDQYKKTRNFNRSDLLKLNALLPQAITRMHELDQAPQQAAEQGQTASQADGMQAIKESAQAHINGNAAKQDQGIGQ